MTSRTIPSVRQMIRDAVENLETPTTNVAVRDWIETRYPRTNRGTIAAQLIVCAVNQPSRVYYSENSCARECDDPRYDFLYCPSRGQLEWYRPAKHGAWRIEQDEEGKCAICRDGEAFIYPKSRERKVVRPRNAAGALPPIKPITPAQVEAANALHHLLPNWAATDRSFERLGRHFGWDHEGCILKAAAINGLYSTRVFAIWRMAEHLRQIMADPPDDPATLVEAIAKLPMDDGTVPRTHWSFASKVCHFFVDSARIPIYDSFCRGMITYHLGKARCTEDPSDPYRAFITDLSCLREESDLSCPLRHLDRYLWLAGQYREWLENGENATLNSELRSVFTSGNREAQRLLRRLWPGQQ